MRGAFALAVLAGCSWPSAGPPDVYIVSVDTLRIDHVGAFNPSSPASTPHIDALAADGVRFTEAFSPISVTGPAFCSVMTGKEPVNHGVFTNLFRGGTALAEEHTTLAEQFSAAGYRTGAFVSAFTLRRALGLKQGFLVYNGGSNKNRNGDVTAETMTSWVRVHEGPVFGWYHNFDPHGPVARMLEPGEVDGDWKRDPAHLAHIPAYQRIEDISQHDLYELLYARGVERADRAVGSLIDGLKAADRYDDALIVFLADHGEGFRERALWYDHGTSAHIEQTHVPLIIKYPKAARAGTSDDRLVSLVDVAPTLLDIAGLEPLSGVDGSSLHASGEVRERAVSESSHCKRVPVLDCAPVGGRGKEIAVRTLKHTRVSRSEQSGEVELVFDRKADPIEFRPISEPGDLLEDEILQAVRKDRRSRLYDPLPGESDSDRETRRLRALGYVE